MQVLINHLPFELPPDAPLSLAIERFGITPPFAAAVNLQFVAKTDYAITRLNDNDEIELIAPITGG
jgi:sulfur carrier protein